MTGSGSSLCKLPQADRSLAASPAFQASGTQLLRHERPKLGFVQRLRNQRPGKRLDRSYIPGNEYDLEMFVPRDSRLGELGAAHAGHAAVGEEQRDIRPLRHSVQSLVAGIGLKHLEAEILEYAIVP